MKILIGLLGLIISTIALGAIDRVLSIKYNDEMKENLSNVNSESVEINGVRWATRNVNSFGTFVTNPEDIGMFYQWNRKTRWAATGAVTNWDKTVVEGDDWEKPNDPSPTGYRIPTSTEIDKLLDTSKVTNESIIQNGVHGRKFIDKTNGNYIFFPAAGYRDYNDGTLFNVGSRGLYWSSTRYDNRDAYYLDFGFSAIKYYFDYNCGFSVRPVAE